MALYGVAPRIPTGGAGLQQALQDRLSNQATALQPFTPNQAPPSPPQGPSGGRGQSRVAQLRQQQDADRKGLASKAQDLNIAKKLIQILDPRMPKPARQFLFKELSRTLGIDPKGERSKEIGAMLTSLDPQTMEGLQRKIVESTQTSQPGDVQQLAQGILSGQTPIDMLVPAVADASRPPVVQASFPGSMEQNDAAEADMVQSAQGQNIPPSGIETGTTPDGGGFVATPGLDPSVTPSGATPVAIARESTVPPMMREVVPELTQLLGMPAERFRVIDMVRAGWNRIPSDAEQMRKTAADIRNIQGGVVNALVMGNQLADIMDGKPEVLNVTLGRLPFLGNVDLPNPASARVQFYEMLNGIGRSLGWSQVRDLGRDEQIYEQVQRVSTRFIEINPELQEIANANAVIQSIMINLAFAMAFSKGQSGRHLSDRDVELQLQELGRSASPEQFRASIRSVMRRLYDQYNVNTRTAVGKEVPLAPAMTEDAQDVIRRGSMSPKKLVDNLGGKPDDAMPRGSVQNPWSLDSPHIGIKPGDYVKDEGGKLFKFGMHGSLVSTTDTPPAPPAPPTPEPPPSRVSPTLEEEEAAVRKQSQEDRQAVLAARRRAEESASRDQERLDMAKRSEVRTIEEARRKSIQDAFSAIANALQNTSGSEAIGRGLPSMGGGRDQNPAAFQVAPAPQRRPPTPVDASRFNRGQ